MDHILSAHEIDQVRKLESELRVEQIERRELARRHRRSRWLNVALFAALLATNFAMLCSCEYVFDLRTRFAAARQTAVRTEEDLDRAIARLGRCVDGVQRLDDNGGVIWLRVVCDGCELPELVR